MFGCFGIESEKNAIDYLYPEINQKLKDKFIYISSPTNFITAFWEFSENPANKIKAFLAKKVYMRKSLN